LSPYSTGLSKDEKSTARMAGTAEDTIRGPPVPIRGQLRTQLGGKRLLSYSDLRKLGLRWSRQWLSVQVKAGRFPKPLKIGPATNAWLESEWNAWLEAKAAERDNEAAA
jgi:predicted DNA-binding transcriptional regulator AlpA